MNTKKVTMVTGAASGIGRATALMFAERGHHVICTDLPDTKIDEMQALTGGICITADVRVESEVDALFKGAVGKYGRIDGVVNCAGIEEKFIDARDMSLEIFEQTMSTNVTGSFLIARAALAQYSAHTRCR
jgi:NAD(P)-dependent dehydrogenase (short-subunit alcohol dehydrogenase family)